MFVFEVVDDVSDLQVYRKKWIVHIDRITREKANGATVYIGIHPSKVC